MINIKHVLADDAALIANIGAKSFFDAFSESTSPEDMQNYLLEKFSAVNITKEIADPDSEFFAAYYNNIPAGYMKLIKNPLPEKIKDRNAIELQRIYLLKEFYGKKIGNEMMRVCVDFVQERGFDSIWLAVWHLNQRAVKFYKQRDFEIFSTRTFRLGNDLKDDYLMIKYLINKT